MITLVGKNRWRFLVFPPKKWAAQLIAILVVVDSAKLQQSRHSGSFFFLKIALSVIELVSLLLRWHRKQVIIINFNHLQHLANNKKMHKRVVLFLNGGGESVVEEEAWKWAKSQCKKSCRDKNNITVINIMGGKNGATVKPFKETFGIGYYYPRHLGIVVVFVAVTPLSLLLLHHLLLLALFSLDLFSLI